MRKIIGNEVQIYLKGSTIDGPDIIGFLVDCVDGNLYLRRSADDTSMYVVPRSNVNYFLINHLSQNISTIDNPQNNKELGHSDSNELQIFIDGDKIGSISVPLGISLSHWSDEIYNLVISNNVVQEYLVGKVQKSVEYYPGMVYISTSNTSSNDTQNTFSMSNNDATSKFLDPIQMVSKLQNFGKQRNDNGNKET